MKVPVLCQARCVVVDVRFPGNVKLIRAKAVRCDKLANERVKVFAVALPFRAQRPGVAITVTRLTRVVEVCKVEAGEEGTSFIERREPHWPSNDGRRYAAPRTHDVVFVCPRVIVSNGVQTCV